MTDSLLTRPPSTTPGHGRHRRAADRAARRQPRSRPGAAGTRATTILLALCLPLAAAVAVLLATGPGAGPTVAQRAAAVQAARSEVVDILSYDYRSLPADIAKARADTTGPFRGQYALAAQRLLAQAVPLRAIVQASVVSAGIVDASANQVVVLMFVDQASVKQLTASAAPSARIDQTRVRVVMVRTHGRWLVSQLNGM